MQPVQQQERSLGELFGDLAHQTSTLVRDEIQLARTEMTTKAVQAGRRVGLIGAGAVLAHVGVFAILAGIILALGEVMPFWLAALLVGVLVAGAGGALVQVGMTALKRMKLTPEETVQTLQENKLWLQDQMK